MTDNRRVVFDGQVFAEQTHGGVTRYFSSLISGLAARRNWQPVVFAPLTRARVPAEATRLGPNLALPRLSRGFTAMRKINELLTPLAPIKGDFVYHPTWHHIPTIDRIADVPLVFTVMDMIPERYPATSSPQQLEYRATLFERADALVSISTATKDLLIDMYPSTAAKVRTIPVPVPDSATAQHNSAPDRSFVYIGKRGSYKNFATVIEALALVPTDITVAYVGGGPLEPEFVAQAARLGVSDQLISESAPSDDQLATLLSNSSGLISPSLEEGFGIPPLEALRAGSRAIVADIPVYRELYSRAATFFSPADPEALAECMTSLAGVPAEEPVEDLRSHLGWDSNEQMFAAFEQVYQAVLSG